jgi:hypothetical protein
MNRLQLADHRSALWRVTEVVQLNGYRTERRTGARTATTVVGEIRMYCETGLRWIHLDEGLMGVDSPLFPELVWALLNDPERSGWMAIPDGGRLDPLLITRQSVLSVALGSRYLELASGN